jgi:Sulfotransferase family
MLAGSGAQAPARETEARVPCADDDLHAEAAQEMEELSRLYDFVAIDTVAAIAPWGRSGSILLASYFDGHDQVMALPALRSNSIYIFFAAHSTLSLHEKLLAYPSFEEAHDPHSEAAGCGRSLFDGPFAIDRRRYSIVAQAVSAVYDTLPLEFATSSKGFFIAVHVTFDRVLGRRPRSRTPLIVCALHEWDNPTATHLIEEFPNVLFLHAVRDPICSVDRLFDWFFDPDLLTDRQPTAVERAERARRSGRSASVLAAWMALQHIVDADRPHRLSAGRTRVVRFEDLHHRTADTMRDLAGRLGIEFTPSLTESTFAGKPYVVDRGGKSWSGPRRERLRRGSPNLSPMDRALIYALFYENCLAWGYPCPRAFDYRLLRLAVMLLTVLRPTRMEVIVAKVAWRRRVWPWLKRGHWRTPVDTLARIAFSRAAICHLALREIPRRLIRRTHPVELSGPKESPFDEPIR